MRHPCSTPLRILLSLAFVPWAAVTGALASPSDPGWPRTYSDGQAEITIHQPQIEAWLDFKHLKGRCAFALWAARSQEPVYGMFRFDGDTLADADRKLVLIRNLRATDLRFPGRADSAAAEWRETTRRLLHKDALVVSLDRILAYVKASEAPRLEARVVSDPPPNSGICPGGLASFACGSPAIESVRVALNFVRGAHGVSSENRIFFNLRGRPRFAQCSR